MKAIVYGVDTQIGLNLVRELGKRGCEVTAVGKKSSAAGLFSRYTTHGYVLPSREEQACIALLKRIYRETGASQLLCVAEDDILFFNRVKAQLPELHILVPEQQLMDKVLDKSATMVAAQKVGIRVPRSIQLTDFANLAAVIADLSFPVVLKWSNPLAVMRQAGTQGIPIKKLQYVYDAEELQRVMKTFVPLNAYPMIQEYCAGFGLGQFFFMHNDQDLLRFQHQRIHEWPPEGGYSSLCESVPLDRFQALQNKSLALLRELGWQGVAMVEYRYDPVKDEAVLMEINGRFWGSYPLAYHSNVPFAWYTLNVQGYGRIPHVETRKEGLRCRNLLVELKRLHRICFQPEKIQDKSRTFSTYRTFLTLLAGFLSFRTRYYLFALGDLRPVISDLQSNIRKLFL